MRETRTPCPEEAEHYFGHRRCNTCGGDGFLGEVDYTPPPLRAHDHKPCGEDVGQSRDWYGVRTFPTDPAYIRIGGRYVNTRFIAEVRLEQNSAAVWLAGRAEPIRAEGADAQVIRNWMEEMFA